MWSLAEIAGCGLAAFAAIVHLPQRAPRAEIARLLEDSTWPRMDCVGLPVRAAALEETEERNTAPRSRPRRGGTEELCKGRFVHLVGRGGIAQRMQLAAGDRLGYREGVAEVVAERCHCATHFCNRQMSRRRGTSILSRNS